MNINNKNFILFGQCKVLYKCVLLLHYKLEMNAKIAEEFFQKVSFFEKIANVC